MSPLGYAVSPIRKYLHLPIVAALRDVMRNTGDDAGHSGHVQSLTKGRNCPTWLDLSIWQAAREASFEATFDMIDRARASRMQFILQREIRNSLATC